MALNRAAVSAGLVSANDQYEFRATHDVRRKAQSEDKSRSRTRRIPPSMVFGIATRYGSLLKNVLIIQQQFTCTNILKFQACSHLLWLNSPVCVGPGRFFWRNSYIYGYTESNPCYRGILIL